MNPIIERLIRFIEAKNDHDAALKPGEDLDLIDFLKEMDQDLGILKTANAIQREKLGDLEERLQTNEALLGNTDKALEAVRKERDYWQRVAQNLAKELPTTPLRPVDEHAKSGDLVVALFETGEWATVRYDDDNPEYPWEEGEMGQRWREDMIAGYMPLPSLKDLLWRKE